MMNYIYQEIYTKKNRLEYKQEKKWKKSIYILKQNCRWEYAGKQEKWKIFWEKRGEEKEEERGRKKGNCHCKIELYKPALNMGTT